MNTILQQLSVTTCEEVNGSDGLTFTDNENRDSDWQLLNSNTTAAYPGLLLSSGAHSSVYTQDSDCL